LAQPEKPPCPTTAAAFWGAADAGLAEPKIGARFADLGGTAMGGSPADFGKLIADETEKWGKVVRAANMKGE
jgi:hypothetical protein